MLQQQDNAKRDREKDSQEERMLLRMRISPDAREQNRLKRVHEMMEQIYMERSQKKLSEEHKTSDKNKDTNDRTSGNSNFRRSMLSNNPPKLRQPARPVSPQHATLDFTDQNLITGSLIQETYDSNEFFKQSTKKIRHAITTANSLFHIKKKKPEFLAIPDPDDLIEVVNYSEKKRSKAVTIKERISQLTSRKTSVHDNVVIDSQIQGIQNISTNSNPPVDQSDQRVNNLRANKRLSPAKTLSLENPSKLLHLHNKSTSSERQMSLKELEREGKLSLVRTKLGLLNADEKKKDFDITIQKLQRQIDVIDNNIGLIQILPKLNKRKKFSYVLPNQSNDPKKVSKNALNSATDNNNNQPNPSNSHNSNSNELKNNNCDNIIKNSTLNSGTSPYLTVTLKDNDIGCSNFEDKVAEIGKQLNINLDCGADLDSKSQNNQILIDKTTKAAENDTKFKVFFKQTLDPQMNLKQSLSPQQKLQIRTASVPIKYRQRMFSDHSSVVQDTCKHSPKHTANEATFYIPKLILPIERWGNHQVKHNDINTNAKISQQRQSSNLLNFPHSTTSSHTFNKSLNKTNFRNNTNNTNPYSSLNRNTFCPWSTSNRGQVSDKSTEGEEQSANRTIFNNWNITHNNKNPMQNIFATTGNSNKLAKKVSSVKAIKLINDMGQLQKENEENGKTETAYAASQVKLIKKDLQFWESEFNEYNTVADKNLLEDIYIEMKEKDLAVQEHQ